MYQTLLLLGNMTAARATKVRFVRWVAQRTFHTACLSTGMTFGDLFCFNVSLCYDKLTELTEHTLVAFYWCLHIGTNF